MTNPDVKIGESAFYKIVGGPNAQVPREAGASVIIRLLNTQVRDACRVNPRLIDTRTKEMIKGVDKFYEVKRVSFGTSAPLGVEANPARKIFEVSGLPQDMLAEIRTKLDTQVAPLEQRGVPGKIVARVIREQTASSMARTAVRTKIKSIFGFD